MTLRRSEWPSATRLAAFELLAGSLGAIIFGLTLERALLGLIAGLFAGLLASIATTTRQQAEPRPRFAGPVPGPRRARYRPT